MAAQQVHAEPERPRRPQVELQRYQKTSGEVGRLTSWPLDRSTQQAYYPFAWFNSDGITLTVKDKEWVAERTPSQRIRGNTIEAATSDDWASGEVGLSGPSNSSGASKPTTPQSIPFGTTQNRQSYGAGTMNSASRVPVPAMHQI